MSLEPRERTGPIVLLPSCELVFGGRRNSQVTTNRDVTRQGKKRTATADDFTFDHTLKGHNHEENSPKRSGEKNELSKFKVPISLPAGARAMMPALNSDY